MVADPDPFDALADLVHHPRGVLPDSGGQLDRVGCEDLAFADPPVDGVHARLRRAVTERAPDEGLIAVLRREIQALVRHCSAEGAAPIWTMVDGSAALRQYEESMRLRHAESLGAAIAADPGLPGSPMACRAIARFAIDAYALSRGAADPQAAVDEVFRMIEAAWEAA